MNLNYSLLITHYSLLQPAVRGSEEPSGSRREVAL